MHDIYTLGAPLLVVLVGLIFNGQQVRELRSETRSMREELRSETRLLREELRGDIQRLTARMDARLDAIEKQRG